MDNNTLNPFLSVWLHPKQTARYMIDHKTMGFAMIILTICSIIALPINFFDYGGPLSWGFIIATIIFSPIVTIVGMFISALIAWGVGKLFKGVATYTEMYRATSIASIPSAMLGPIYLIWFVVSPDFLLTPDFEGPIPAIFWIAILLSIVLGIWSFVVSVGAVAEAHQFSNWKAFFTLVIPAIIIFIILFAFGAVLIWAMFSSF
ncbi:Yip1 family protein [Metasolibacillus sp. FSL H7-0170]|uniref:Yip1 family protein n=1 Tax=Metasolibacillus TaxID=2703677 RepID=UPI000D351EAF|nr:Yip1 family protein [Metasolibacillus fluoroglycofenilyticus]